MPEIIDNVRVLDDGHRDTTARRCPHPTCAGYRYMTDISSDLFSIMAESSRDYPMVAPDQTWDEYAEDCGLNDVANQLMGLEMLGF